jgi:hypothetical protein
MNIKPNTILLFSFIGLSLITILILNFEESLFGTLMPFYANGALINTLNYNRNSSGDVIASDGLFSFTQLSCELQTKSTVYWVISHVISFEDDICSIIDSFFSLWHYTNSKIVFAYFMCVYTSLLLIVSLLTMIGVGYIYHKVLVNPKLLVILSIGITEISSIVLWTYYVSKFISDIGDTPPFVDKLLFFSLHSILTFSMLSLLTIYIIQWKTKNIHDLQDEYERVT